MKIKSQIFRKNIFVIMKKEKLLRIYKLLGNVQDETHIFTQPRKN